MHDFKFGPPYGTSRCALLGPVALAASAVLATLLDARGDWHTYVKTRVRTGAAVSGTHGVQWDAHQIIHRENLGLAVVATGTSLRISSFLAGRIMVGDVIFVENELVTVTAAPALGGGVWTVAVTAFANSHALNVWVALIASVAGTSWTHGSGSINTTVGMEQQLGNGDYVLVASNLDGTDGVTIAADLTCV